MARQKVKVDISTYKFNFNLIINKAIETQLLFFLHIISFFFLFIFIKETIFFKHISVFSKFLIVVVVVFV